MQLTPHEQERPLLSYAAEPARPDTAATRMLRAAALVAAGAP